MTRLPWPSFFSPYIKVDCRDGPRFILRKPEKAFSIVVPDWDTRIKAVVKGFKVAEPNLETELRKKVRAIVENLDKHYAELQAHYQAAYLQFCSNPCSRRSNKALERANEEIRKMEFKLREIEIKTEKFLQLPTVPFEEEISGLVELKPKKFIFGERKRMAIVGLRGVQLRALLGDIYKLVSEFRHSTV